MQSNYLPVFPFAHHILPQGKLPLKISEQRYLDMVKQVMKSEQTFIIAMLDEGKICTMATKVKVVDFESLPNQFLGIIVEGVELVELSQFRRDEAGLDWAAYQAMPEMSDLPIAKEFQYLANNYRTFLSENPTLSELYPVPDYQSTGWIVQRWLEILPFTSQQKQVILQANDIDLYLNAIGGVEMHF